MLYELDPIKFKQIVNNNNMNFRSSIDSDSVKLNDIYLYTNLSAEAFLLRLRILTEEIGLDLNDLSFTIL
jgi:hypothetical protein